MENQETTNKAQYEAFMKKAWKGVQFFAKKNDVVSKGSAYRVWWTVSTAIAHGDFKHANILEVILKVGTSDITKLCLGNFGWQKRQRDAWEWGLEMAQEITGDDCYSFKNNPKFKAYFA